MKTIRFDNKEIEEYILIPMLNGNNVSRWTIMKYNKPIKSLIAENKKYASLTNLVNDSIESCRESI